MINNLVHIHLKLLQKQQFEKKRKKKTGDLIGNKIAYKITKPASRSIPQTISSKTEVTDAPPPVGKSIISPYKTKQIIDTLWITYVCK